MTPNLINRKQFTHQLLYPYVKKYNAILSDDNEVIVKDKDGQYTKYTGVFLVKRIGIYQARRGNRNGRILFTGETAVNLVKRLFENFWRDKCYSDW